MTAERCNYRRIPLASSSTLNFVNRYEVLTSAKNGSNVIVKVNIGEGFLWEQAINQWRTHPKQPLVGPEGEGMETVNVGRCSFRPRANLVATAWRDGDRDREYWAWYDPDFNAKIGNPIDHTLAYFINDSPLDWELRFECNDNDTIDNFGDIRHRIAVIRL